MFFLLKEMPHYTARAVTHLFNQIVKTLIFSEGLKTARILPILEKGKDPALQDSFSPVSNVNCIKKINEKMMRIQINEYLEEEKVILGTIMEVGPGSLQSLTKHILT